MIIVKIYGGLGNQLFQYASAKNLGLKFNHEVFIDKSWYDNIPGSNTKRTYLLDKFRLNEGYLNIKYGKIISKKSSDKNYLTDCPNRRCPQITKAIINLGYKPEISIDEGLTKTLLWYMENYK